MQPGNHRRGHGEDDRMKRMIVRLLLEAAIQFIKEVLPRLLH